MRCKDGKEFEFAGNAFQLEGVFANAATSVASVHEGFTSSLFCLRKCSFTLRGEVGDLKKALHLELAHVWAGLSNRALVVRQSKWRRN